MFNGWLSFCFLVVEPFDIIYQNKGCLSLQPFLSNVYISFFLVACEPFQVFIITWQVLKFFGREHVPVNCKKTGFANLLKFLGGMELIVKQFSSQSQNRSFVDMMLWIPIPSKLDFDLN